MVYTVDRIASYLVAATILTDGIEPELNSFVDY